MASRRSPRSRLHERTIATVADFRRLRGTIGDWRHLPRHPEHLAALAAGVTRGLFGHLSSRELEALARDVSVLDVSPDLALRQYVDLAYIANSLARVVRDSGGDKRLLRELYVAKARWIEQAIFLARKDGDTRLSIRQDGSPSMWIVDFTDLIRKGGGVVKYGFHMPLSRIRQDAPQLAAILFGS